MEIRYMKEGFDACTNLDNFRSTTWKRRWLMGIKLQKDVQKNRLYLHTSRIRKIFKITNRDCSISGHSLSPRGGRHVVLPKPQGGLGIIGSLRSA